MMEELIRKQVVPFFFLHLIFKFYLNILYNALCKTQNEKIKKDRERKHPILAISVVIWILMSLS